MHPAPGSRFPTAKSCVASRPDQASLTPGQDFFAAAFLATVRFAAAFFTGAFLAAADTRLAAAFFVAAAF